MLSRNPWITRNSRAGGGYAKHWSSALIDVIRETELQDGSLQIAIIDDFSLFWDRVACKFSILHAPRELPEPVTFIPDLQVLVKKSEPCSLSWCPDRVHRRQYYSWLGLMMFTFPLRLVDTVDFKHSTSEAPMFQEHGSWWCRTRTLAD